MKDIIMHIQYKGRFASLDLQKKNDFQKLYSILVYVSVLTLTTGYSIIFVVRLKKHVKAY